jgi:lipopolysaccharide transport system ATP-binding protein
MSDPVIEVKNLGKSFMIGHQQTERYTALRDVIARNVKGAFRKTMELVKGNQFQEGLIEEFWALDDVSFQINRGERVGIIGRNGAGKSTLLKVLSRITEPTKGMVRIRGKVASLLEVGTGFHPELTGRENIFLNGAILGMGRAEIKKKFDEIVAFAEVERFLDTPVKRFSSGMYVRLAFAVAAHLQPEILIVDEVLAVGDAQFQKKCLGKMEDVSRNEGRTVLFVSHNMGTVKALCSKAILMQNGRLISQGNTYDIVKEYSSASFLQQAANYKHISGDGKIRITKIDINQGLNVVSIYSRINITIEYTMLAEMKNYHFFILFHNSDGDVVWSIFQKDQHRELPHNGTSVTLVAENILMPGVYHLSAGLFNVNNEFVDWVDRAESLEVENTFDNGGAFDYRYGTVTTKAVWNA